VKKEIIKIIRKITIKETKKRIKKFKMVWIEVKTIMITKINWIKIKIMLIKIQEIKRITENLKREQITLKNKILINIQILGIKEIIRNKTIVIVKKMMTKSEKVKIFGIMSRIINKYVKIKIIKKGVKMKQ